MAKAKKRSRWVAGSGVPRYDDHATKYIARKYREWKGWHQGARVAYR